MWGEDRCLSQGPNTYGVKRIRVLGLHRVQGSQLLAARWSQPPDPGTICRPSLSTQSLDQPGQGFPLKPSSLPPGAAPSKLFIPSLLELRNPSHHPLLELRTPNISTPPGAAPPNSSSPILELSPPTHNPLLEPCPTNSSKALLQPCSPNPSSPLLELHPPNSSFLSRR